MSLSGGMISASLTLQGGRAAPGQADGHPGRFAPLALLLGPYCHDQIIDVGDLAAVIRAQVHMLLDNRSGTIGTDVNVGQIESQKLVGSASDAL